MKRLLLGFVLFALPVTVLAELAGSWTLSVDTPRGVQNPKMVVTNTEEGYQGTYHSLRGPLEMKNIQTDGEKFSFDLTLTVPIGTFEVQYTGTIAGDELSGQVENPRGTVPFSGVRDQ